ASSASPAENEASYERYRRPLLSLEPRLVDVSAEREHERLYPSSAIAATPRGMTLIIVVSSLTLFGSFLCSLFEAALYAITPSQLALLLEQNRSGARKLSELRADVEEPIAAILTINTITHTVGASVCGALVADHFGGNTAVGIFAAAFTVAVLLLTEIIPKSYGVRHAVRLAPLIVWPLQVMIWAVWPIVKGSGWLMRLLTGGGDHSGPTEDEVVVMS